MCVQTRLNYKSTDFKKTYSTKVAQCSTLVAPYSTKVGIKKISSKHTHTGSSFEDPVAMNPTVKTDQNSDVWFKRYDFIKI